MIIVPLDGSATLFLLTVSSLVHQQVHVQPRSVSLTDLVR